MTGSSLAPLIIPIVVACALAVWLGMVFYADARPGWKAHRTALERGVADTKLLADARGRNERQDIMTAAEGGPAAADRGSYETAPPASAPPPQRAA